MVPSACPRCGTPTEADAHFCGLCGARLVEVTATPARVLAPAAAALPVPPALDELAMRLATTQLDLAPPRTPAGPTPPVAHAAHAGPVHAAPSAPPPAAVTPTAAPDRGAAGMRRVTGPTTLEKLVGRTLNGRYLVERKIGEGGFGAVFRGRQLATGREIALKLLHPHNVSDTTVVARFRREAEACSKLSNPHTVMTFDFDQTDDGVLYLAMELVRGRPLQDVQRLEGPLPPSRVLPILSQVADALGEAHQLGIVHRDMKPENVMIDSHDGDDFVKVLDFGIAKIVEESGRPAQALTAVGQTLGTLEFMSPEQLRGQRLDGRSDIYALGIMAYEMLTGMLPWKVARGPTEIIQFHLQGAPPSPSSLRPELRIPREVDDVVLKMVAKDRSDRHDDAADLRQHIARAVGALERSVRRKEALRVAGVIGGLAVAITALILLVSR